MNEDIILDIKSLSSYYENNKGIENINLTVKKGEFIGIIGHNGAGKTTLMNTIIGLKDYSGEIYLKYKYNDIGYVSQKQVIDWYLNIEDNMYMEQMIVEKNNAQENDYIENLMCLKENKKNSVEDLSGGQLQRVIVSRALLKYPQLYILDEPTTSLDAISAEQILEYLLKLTEKGKTVLISSHDLELVEKYCSRVIFIKNGKIKYDGDIDTLCSNKSLRIKFLEELKNEE